MKTAAVPGQAAQAEAGDARSTGVFAPPTAGLPLEAQDLWPRADADLGSALGKFLQLGSLQMTCSGTAALVIALTVLKERAPGRTQVIVPAYTCPLVALAVAHCGLQLRLCDMQPDTLDLDLDSLRALCSEQTLAVVPTHLGGRVVDAGAARQLASAVGAATIEDAAQALGARVDGASVGQDSDFVFFSLAIGKGLTTFEGGALHARDATLREACRNVAARIAPFSLKWELWRSLQLLASAPLYRPRSLRLAYGRPLAQALRRGDWIEAAGDDFSDEIPLHSLGRWRQSVGLRALRRLPGFLQDGRDRAMRRGERLQRIAGLRLLEDSAAVPGADGTWPMLMLLLPDQPRRDLLLNRLWSAGCGVSLPFVHALPDYPQYAHAVPRVADDALPQARAMASRLLTISNSPWLSDARFEWVCGEIERVVRQP